MSVQIFRNAGLGQDPFILAFGSAWVFWPGGAFPGRAVVAVLQLSDKRRETTMGTDLWKRSWLFRWPDMTSTAFIGFRVHVHLIRDVGTEPDKVLVRRSTVPARAVAAASISRWGNFLRGGFIGSIERKPRR